jgi:hypothetical protein
MSCLVSDPDTALRCNWPASLKELPGTLARSGSQARQSAMYPRHSTPFGPMALSTNSLPLNFPPLTWWKPFYQTCVVGRSKRPSKRLHSLAVACGLAWCTSVCMSPRHSHPFPPRRARSLRGWHGLHSHISQARTACHLSGILPRRLRALDDRMDDRHQCLEEYGDALHSQAYPESSSSFAVQGTNHMGRYSPLYREWSFIIG